MEEISLWIAQGDSSNADRFCNLLVDHALSVEKFPKMGRKVPEFNDATIRELSHPPYRIIYRLRESTRQIHVLRFWHAARGTPAL